MITRLGRVLATVVATVAGLFVLIDIFLDQAPDALINLPPNTPTVGGFFVGWAAIITAFALLLGFANVVRVHLGRVRRFQPGAVYSGVLVLAMLATVGLGIIGGPTSASGRFLFNNILQPLEATFAALLALFIATAAYRAFRIRDFESTLFVLLALVVLLGQLPIAIYLWEQLPIIKDFIIEVPTLAGVRGILLGVALGTIATGLRVLIGVDRPYTE